MKRRHFLQRLALATMIARPARAAAEPPPETPRLRLIATGNTCVAPQFVAAEELLRAEGFTDVQYVRTDQGKVEQRPARAMAGGNFDIAMSFITNQIGLVEGGAPVVILAGGHVGCIELVAREPIRSLRDLRGKTVAVGTRDAFSPEYS